VELVWLSAVAVVVAAVAAVATAAQSSSLLLSSSSSSLLVLLAGIILPLFVARCSFRRPPLARLQCAMVGCSLRLSAAFFVITRHPIIVDDCVAGHWPPAHLVAFVLPAAGAIEELYWR